MTYPLPTLRRRLAEATPVKERPILFSGPMVRAVLAGRKTQTRRIVHPRMYLVVDGDEDTGRVVGQGLDEFGALATEHARCPYGAPGDRLWVRETWYDDTPGGGPNRARFDDGVAGIEYRATHDCRNFEAGCPCKPDGDGKRSEWRPSIFMPRWASRITLEITSVRVERLQAISTLEAMAEGVDPRPVATGFMSYTHGFRVLWDKINGERAPWDSNPWVWAIGFRRALEAEEGGAK